jgi:hypothetical protein
MRASMYVSSGPALETPLSFARASFALPARTSSLASFSGLATPAETAWARGSCRRPTAISMAARRRVVFMGCANL